MDKRLQTAWVALRLGIGVTAALAGLDKFFNLLADWGSYVSPAAAQLLPVSIPTFMALVGVIEIAVGAAILTGFTRLGAYAASAWLLAVAANLVLAGFYDIAVRDVVMSLAAFTLARLAELRGDAPAYAIGGVVTPSHERARA
jgi:uncharacterized membrane protein YphA (DoxX/SURF4 family)